MPNLLQYPIVIFAALKAGLVIVNKILFTQLTKCFTNTSSGAKAIILENLQATRSHFAKDN